MLTTRKNNATSSISSIGRKVWLIEVLTTLSQYRADARMDGGLTFGMNAIILGGVGHTLRVGDAVAADWRFD